MKRFMLSGLTFAILGLALLPLTAFSAPPSQTSVVTPSSRVIPCQPLATTTEVVGSVTLHVGLYISQQPSNNYSCATNLTYVHAAFTSNVGENETVGATYIDNTTVESVTTLSFSNATVGNVNGPVVACNPGDVIQGQATLSGTETAGSPLIVSATCP